MTKNLPKTTSSREISAKATINDTATIPIPVAELRQQFYASQCMTEQELISKLKAEVSACTLKDYDEAICFLFGVREDSQKAINKRLSQIRYLLTKYDPGNKFITTIRSGRHRSARAYPAICILKNGYKLQDARIELHARGAGFHSGAGSGRVPVYFSAERIG